MEMHFIYFPGPVSAVTLLNDCGLLFPDFSLPSQPSPPSFTRPLRTDPYVRIDRYVSNNLAIILVNPRIAHTFILQGRNVNDERERDSSIIFLPIPLFILIFSFLLPEAPSPSLFTDFYYSYRVMQSNVVYSITITR